MSVFQTAGGDWKRVMVGLDGGFTEVDFHRTGQDGEWTPYEHRMQQVYDDALAALRDAQESGVPHVLFRHGWSTSEGWKTTTSRSVVRGLMRSPAATPYIVRSKCIQHYSVFVAAIRPQ
ncbi:hypothetical protein ACXDF8_26495 [Mycolicibacterium sp. CBM1]